MASERDDLRSDPASELVGAVLVADRRAGIWCVTQCARTVSEYVLPGDDTLLPALDLAEAWVRGEATAEACLARWEAARAGPTLGRRFRGHWVPGSVARILTMPAQAIAGLEAEPGDEDEDEDDEEPDDPAEAQERWYRLLGNSTFLTACAHADVAYNQAFAKADPAKAEAAGDRARRAELTRKRAELEALVRGLSWPATTPPDQALARAPDVLRERWARDGGPRTLTMGELAGAHRRAVEAGLDWADPVVRALAERIEDPSALR